MPVSRRNFLVSSLAIPSFLSARSAPSSPRLKIVVTGGHPGDPECGCAGTIARYTSLGHEVVLLYLNRGEGFCGGLELSRCAGIRTKEAQKACKILNARAVFGNEIDGQAVVDNSHYTALQHLLEAEKPDVVFCQWPIDTHRDHRALSSLVLDAWIESGKKAALYYYEVAGDTMMFSPSDYVDVSDSHVDAMRRAACYAHSSQEPEKWYPAQVTITRFRGAESGYAQAESFLRHRESKRGFLP